MEVNSIEWHENNLKNYTIFLNNKIKELECLEKVILKGTRDIVFREYQIHEAKKEGKLKFNADKYKIKIKTLKQCTYTCKKEKQFICCFDCKYLKKCDGPCSDYKDYRLCENLVK